MGVQPLMPGKVGDAVLHLAQRFPGIVDEAGFLDESSTLNGLLNRAVPLVGSVWLGPAK